MAPVPAGGGLVGNVIHTEKCMVREMTGQEQPSGSPELPALRLGVPLAKA